MNARKEEEWMGEGKNKNWLNERLEKARDYKDERKFIHIEACLWILLSAVEKDEGERTLNKIFRIFFQLAKKLILNLNNPLKF